MGVGDAYETPAPQGPGFFYARASPWPLGRRGGGGQVLQVLPSLPVTWHTGALAATVHVPARHAVRAVCLRVYLLLAPTALSVRKPRRCVPYPHAPSIPLATLGACTAEGALVAMCGPPGVCEFSGVAFKPRCLPRAGQ